LESIQSHSAGLYALYTERTPPTETNYAVVGVTVAKVYVAKERNICINGRRKAKFI